MKSLIWRVAAVLALLLCVGCGKETYDVEALVTLDGKPLEGATVTLISIGETRSRPAAGISDVQGIVRFTTFQPDDGVLPGEYKVLVSKMPTSLDEEFANFDPDNPEDLHRMQARERGRNVPYTPTALPRSYLNAAESPFSLKVPPNNDEVVFALESSPARPR